MKQTTNKPHRLTTNVSAKLTADQRRQLVQAAARDGISPSEFTRQLILSAVGVSRDTRLQMEFQIVGEERIRLLIAAATKGRDVEDPDVQAEIEHRAFLSVPGLTARRLSTLAQLFVEEAEAYGEGE